MANRDLLINALINKAVGSGMVFQVSAAQIRDELQNGVTIRTRSYDDPGPDQSPGLRPHGRSAIGWYVRS